MDIAVVLGGDGTMLRALGRFLELGVPVIGVNFGRVGFLASIEPERLEPGLTRVFGGDYRVVELPTLDARSARTPRSRSTTSSSRARASAGWSSSSGRSAARISAASRATG